LEKNNTSSFVIIKIKNRTPFELSGGEKKKLAFAANVIANQKFYIF